MAAYLRTAVDSLIPWKPTDFEAAGPDFGPPPAGPSDLDAAS
jgi:hypothetical protein